jgi:hypothetical protein
MLGKLVASGCLEFTHLTNPAIMQAFDITPDGKQIVFDRIRENSDVLHHRSGGNGNAAVADPENLRADRRGTSVPTRDRPSRG